MLTSLDYFRAGGLSLLFPNRALTFAFTASSILMSGGHARLKPSPGIFFVASMPSLLPDVFIRSRVRRVRP